MRRTFYDTLLGNEVVVFLFVRKVDLTVSNLTCCGKRDCPSSKQEAQLLCLAIRHYWIMQIQPDNTAAST